MNPSMDVASMSTKKVPRQGTFLIKLSGSMGAVMLHGVPNVSKVSHNRLSEFCLCHIGHVTEVDVR